MPCGLLVPGGEDEVNQRKAWGSQRLSPQKLWEAPILWSSELKNKTKQKKEKPVFDQEPGDRSQVLYAWWPQVLWEGGSPNLSVPQSKSWSSAEDGPTDRKGPPS